MRGIVHCSSAPSAGYRLFPSQSHTPIHIPQQLSAICRLHTAPIPVSQRDTSSTAVQRHLPATRCPHPSLTARYTPSQTHLDGLAVHGGNDIARFGGSAAGHVLTQRYEGPQIGGQAEPGGGVQHTHWAGGAAHVGPHLVHARGRLQRDTAAVKRHTLTWHREIEMAADIGQTQTNMTTVCWWPGHGDRYVNFRHIQTWVMTTVCWWPLHSVVVSPLWWISGCRDTATVWFPHNLVSVVTSQDSFI